ncbi:putative transposase [Streptomyces venezuelae]|nr:putative transposase [Streptomyces venezuelae]CUM43951.1 Mobile element protein [Streptomyces venezuelae]
MLNLRWHELACVKVRWQYRRLVWATGVKPVIARRGVRHGSGLGVHRWVVERNIAWLHGDLQLRIR